MINEAVAVAATTGVFGVILAVLNNGHQVRIKALEQEAGSDGFPRLKYHPVFSKIQMLRNRVVLELEMDSEGRKRIAKDVLLHKLQFCEEEFRALATDHDARVSSCSGECSNCQWVFDRHVLAIDNVLRRCNDYYRTDDYTPEEQAVLSLVWTKFNHYHQPHIDNLLQVAERTVNSKFYKDCPVQSSIIFDHESAILGSVITDAEETFKVINGELTGRGPFRGVIIDYEKLNREKGA